MPIPLIQDEPSVDYYDKYLGGDLENTFLDSVDAAFKMGASNTIGDAIRDINEMKNLRTRSTRTLTPQELNQTYRDSGVLFKENTPDLVAEEIVKRANDRRKLAERIGSGPSGFMAGVANFSATLGGSLWGSVTDPVDLGINVLAAPFTVGRFGALAARAGRMTWLAAEGLTGVLARGAAEGVVTGAVSTPVLAYRDAQEQRDWHAMDALKNYGMEIFTSSAFAGGAYGLSKAWKYMRRSDNGPGIAGLAAVEQLAAGKRPSIKPIESLFQEHVKAQSVDISDYSGRVGRKSMEIGELHEPVSGRLYYAIKESYDDAAAVPGLLQSSLYESDFGQGVYLTNDAGLANNVAVTGFNETGAGGRVFEADISNARLASVNDTLLGRELEALQPILKEMGVKDRTASLADIFDKAESFEIGRSDQLKEKINATMKALGYDGYALRDMNGEGREGVMLFGEDKVKLGNGYETDRRLLNADVEKELQEYGGYMGSKESDLFHDAHTAKNYQEAAVEKDIAAIDRDLETTRAEVISQVKELDSLGALSKEEQDILAAIEGEGAAPKGEAEGPPPFKKQLSSAEKLIKAAMACVGRS